MRVGYPRATVETCEGNCTSVPVMSTAQRLGHVVDDEIPGEPPHVLTKDVVVVVRRVVVGTNVVEITTAPAPGMNVVYVVVVVVRETDGITVVVTVDTPGPGPAGHVV